MRIVVLDGHALNPGDLSWKGLQALGFTTVHDRTAPDEVLSRAAEAEVLLTNKTVLSRSHIEQLPHLRYIGVLATGYNVVNVEAAAQRGVVVTNVPDYGAPSVAQMVFAHLFHFARHVAEHARQVSEGGWTRSVDWCFWSHPLVELSGLTMGVVGLGRIGRATARIALAMEMRVLAHDVRPAPVEGVTFTDLETLLRESDVVSLHCPLTPQTERLINRERLEWMKPTAFLINTSRGPLIDETALAEALNEERLAGAGLDVLSVEPPPADNPLLSARNCAITPHIAWATRAARQRLLDTAVANLAAYLAGQPQNVVARP